MNRVMLGRRLWGWERKLRGPLARLSLVLRLSGVAAGAMSLAAPAEETAFPLLSQSWCRVVAPSAAWAAQSPARSPTLGTNQVLLYRLRFAGDTNDWISARDADEVMAASAAAFDQISYGRFGITWAVTPSLVLPLTREEYGSAGHEELAADARALALAAGFDWAQFQFDLFVHRPLPGSFYAGLGNLGRRGAWIVYEGLPGYLPHLVVHELGHNLGLPHANLHYVGNPMLGHPGSVVYGLYGSPPFPSDVGAFTNVTQFDPGSVVGQRDLRTAGLNVEYGDPFDIMGHDFLHRGYSAPYRHRLKWLTTATVATAGADGRFRIYAVDAGRTREGRAYALRIDRALPGHSVDGKRRQYWLQHHGAQGVNANLAAGVQLRWEAVDTDDNGQYVDAAPDTADVSRPESRLLHLGRTFSDVLSQLHFTPAAAGGGGEDRWMEIEVRFGPIYSNRAPEITLTASATNLTAGEAVTFSVAATDADGDSLHYFWDFGDGSVGYGAPVLTHSFTNFPGAAVVRCEVSDGRGGMASRQLPVWLGRPPARIVGRVTDPHGQPLANVQVHNGEANFWSGTWPDLVTTRSDSAGEFILLVKPLRPMSPAAFAYGHRMVLPSPGWQVIVPEDGLARVDFYLEPLPQVRVAFNSSVAAEGNSNVVLTLSRTAPAADELEAVLRYAGTADAADVLGWPATDRVVFPAGVSELQLSVRIARDIVSEGPETLVVTAFPPRSMVRRVVGPGVTNWVAVFHPGWELRPFRGEPAWFMTDPLWAISAESSAVLTIEDTTPPDLPRLSVWAGSEQPREHPPTAGFFHLRRDGSTNQALDVAVSFGEGLAVNGVDFQGIPEFILMPAGVTNVTVSILPLDDGLPEGLEPVVLSLPQPPDLRYGVEQSRAQLIIEDSPIVPHSLAFEWRFGGEKVLAVYGPLGRICTVESSTNLTDWEPFATTALHWQPTSLPLPPFWLEPCRFYRSRLTDD